MDLRLIQTIRLPGPSESVAFDAEGRRILVGVGGSRLLILERRGSTFEPSRTFDLPADAYEEHPGLRPHQDPPRVGWLDDRTAVVARHLMRFGGEVPLPYDRRYCALVQTVDLETGACSTAIEVPGVMLVLSDPVPISPKEVVLAVDGPQARRIDLERGFEVGRIGNPEDSDPPEPPGGFDPEESISFGGIVHDPRRRRLHLLWVWYDSAALETCDVDPSAGEVRSIRRGTPFKGTDALIEGNGLGLSPDGTRLAAFLAVLQMHLPPEDPDVPAPPDRALLGRLAVISEDETRTFDVFTDPKRDLNPIPTRVRDDDGRERLLYWQVGVSDFRARPVFLDDRVVAVNSPSGQLLGIDIASGMTHLLHDLGGPVQALDVHRTSRTLIAVLEDGAASVLQY